MLWFNILTQGQDSRAAAVFLSSFALLSHILLSCSSLDSSVISTSPLGCLHPHLSNPRSDSPHSHAGTCSLQPPGCSETPDLTSTTSVRGFC